MDETPYFFNKNPLQNFTPNELNTVSLLQEIIYQHYLCTSSAQEIYIESSVQALTRLTSEFQG